MNCKRNLQTASHAKNSRRHPPLISLQQKLQSTTKHLQYQLLRVDAILVITLIAYIIVDDPLTRTLSNTISVNLPTKYCRVALELSNLVLFGFFERWIILYILHGTEEWLATLIITKKTWNTKACTFHKSRIMNRRPLPLSKTIRDKDFQLAQSQPWFHNKIAVFLTIAVLLPFDFLGTDTSSNASHGHIISQSVEGSESEWSVVEFDLRKFSKEFILGLFIIDLILGTAHMLSHKGPLQKVLFKYHAKHHSRNHNYSSVKYVGNPFDLEVLLTQICFAFLPRFMGLDVWTGIFLINFFSLQLLLEHSGYNSIFAISQHHEMHHNHGNIAFYHFPLVEFFLGSMPSLEQLESNK